ncbi:UPF0481 protein At3g47200-like isoform X1 [Cucurbita pepo subsp. pepo]|uniref:UPF0481 protein At3g47200-like isoform X1 n=1 Tax=Cucurbita pepo subsp. pepo TaxID=3664 RepID=UPI000C9D83CE|nr:UPF0481 protein At3g47200-like isoform X1 [Cucurbita pepo subsp. pepo]
MEKHPSLQVMLGRDDNIGDKADMVVQVKGTLDQLLDSPAILNMEAEQSSELLSIYKIPFFMTQTHPKAYEPRVVSLGPYNHGKQHLSPMELEKLKLFYSFKTRCLLDVESIVKGVSTILDELMESYDKLEEEWTEDPGKFLQLMIVDGCFMLGFLINCPDSLINVSPDIKQDMLLLENQLPMLLLEKLYSIAARNVQLPQQDLQKLVSNWLNIPRNEVMKDCLHILEMYKESLLHPPIDRTDWSVELDHSDPESQVIPPATKLREAGIKFKRSKTDSLTDVFFDAKGGVLWLPQLMVDDDTESTLLNVMAFEKLHMKAGRRVTSFVILMSNLIDDERDVAVLAGEKVLANAVGNDKEAAGLFNRLGSGAAMGLDTHMAGVHKKVNEHCNQPWNERCATLKHDYFQSPWTIISLCAAIFGFIILILQAIYQFLDYYLKP